MNSFVMDHKSNFMKHYQGAGRCVVSLIIGSSLCFFIAPVCPSVFVSPSWRLIPSAFQLPLSSSSISTPTVRLGSCIKMTVIACAHKSAVQRYGDVTEAPYLNRERACKPCECLWACVETSPGLSLLLKGRVMSSLPCTQFVCGANLVVSLQPLMESSRTTDMSQIAHGQPSRSRYLGWEVLSWVWPVGGG